MWSWSQKWTCEPGCHKLAELRQKGSSFRLLCHMHSGSVSCHCKQCSVWPALLPASASTWNIIHQDISFYNVMPLWLTCLAWECHPHAWRWHAQPASSSKFQRWQAIPNSQLLPGFNWETRCWFAVLERTFDYDAGFVRLYAIYFFQGGSWGSSVAFLQFVTNPYKLLLPLLIKLRKHRSLHMKS